MDARRIQHLLDELCSRLGFCLPPADQDRLRTSPPSDVDGFTEAVLTAEGLGDTTDRRLRESVRTLVARHMNR